MSLNRPASLLSQGFTLIEVMLVLVVMGMIASLVVINPFATDPSAQAKDEAVRFNAVFALASDYAVLNQTTLGLRVEADKNSYSFVMLDDEDNWTEFTEHDYFTAYELPEDMRFELALDGLSWLEEDSFLGGSLFDESLSVSNDRVQIGDEEDEPPPPPAVILYPSGEIGDFAMHFTWENAFNDGFSNSEPRTFSVEARGFLPMQIRDADVDDVNIDTPRQQGFADAF